MNPLLHSLHIGTLATWLSVAGFGAVGVIVPHRPVPSAPRPEASETQWLPQEITLGGQSSPAAPEQPAANTAVADTLPAPPVMPDLAELPPLPEVPEQPPAPRSIRETAAARPPPARTGADGNVPRRTARQSAASATSGAAGGGGAGMSSEARLAAGSMPPPDYPAEARRLGQTGTLVVEFTVDATGRVIAASAKSPSPWPLLNQEAVRTVRRWKFPPGAVMKLQRPIVFQLR